MGAEKIVCASIDEYIASRPQEVQPMLVQIRDIIRLAAPEAGEKISWGMATFTLFGNLVHFAAEKRHIGFHPGPSAVIEFEDELTPYHYSKGTVQFPYAQSLPLELIRRMVSFRVEEQKRLAAAKAAGAKKNI